MKLLSILLCLFGVTTFVYSQDTIQFLNKTVQVVKVSEVGIDEIKYRRIDNLEGPLYVALKNEIRYIKYENGTLDSVRTKKLIPNEDSIRVAKLEHKQLSYKDGRIILNNVSIKNADFLTICKYTSDHGKYNKIKLVMNEVDTKKRKSRRAGIALIPFFVIGGGLSVVGAYVGFMDSNPGFLLAAIPFLSTGTGFAIFSKSQRKQILKLKAEAVALYNN